MSNYSDIKYPSGSITSAQLADGTVVAVDIADGSIVNSKLGSGAVTGSKILDGTINSAKLDSTSQPVSFKNRIINGDMRIDQRNGGASVTPTATAYTVDRWRLNLTQASKFSVQQNQGSITPPVGFTNYIGVTAQSAYSVGASDYFALMQRIEGFNTADLGFGASNAATITLSFWVRSSLTGTFGGALNNENADRTYPFTYTINSANTWEQKSVTIAGDTTGTWAKTNGIGIGVYFSLGSGSTYTSTSGTWQAGNYWGGATGQTSVVGTNGATFYITGVQLEKGSTATSFDYRPYGTELALCQRYYVSNVIGSSECYLSAQEYMSARLVYPVPMRTTPTGSNLSIIGSSNMVTPGTLNTIAAPLSNNLSTSIYSISSGGGHTWVYYSANFSAEL